MACTIAIRKNTRTRGDSTGSRSPKPFRGVCRSWIRPRSAFAWTTRSASSSSICINPAAFERALKESKIGITPAVDGKIIRLPIPELSEERRKELVRSLGKMAEEARVRVRANRHAALDEAKKLKAAGELTEDGLRDVQNEVQKLTDRFVKSIDDHLKHKESEVMKV